ncbi:MAG: response regulator [Planctomycetes bacterium]|nr:response regulator [Planctomycetota bacterium]
MTNTQTTTNILMVDDNPGDVGLVRQVVENVRGIVLHVAHNVTQAHAFLMKMPPYDIAPVPDVIFLDLRMPKLPGYNVIPLVRREPLLRNVKIVMLTSSSLPSHRAQCDALGADDYVVKPGDWEQWQATITRALTRHGIPIHADDGHRATNA